MRGLTFHANQDVRVDDVPEPTIEQPTDALVRVTMAAICGSDLHILNAGEQFGFAPGTRLGHEFIGTVEAVGPEVTGVSAGDRVMSSCSVADGSCTYCLEGQHYACRRWSLFGWAPRVWQQGGAVQGGQSELVRVPLASSTLRRLPESLAGPDAERKVLPLVDVQSTSWHGLASAGLRPGERVVVIGDGAVGLTAVHAAAAKDASAVICLGHHPDRLRVAEQLGATAIVSSRDRDEIAALVKELTGGEGAHVVVDSISGKESFATAHACVRAGGAIANLGMDHFMGKVPEVNWFDQFLRNVRIVGGLVPGPAYFDELVALVERGRMDPSPVLTHTLAIEEAADGYRMMAERREGVIKVALTPAAA